MKLTASKCIAYGVMGIDAVATGAVLRFCEQSILRDFTGSLPYLTALIAMLQAATAVVLSCYFFKSKAENTSGGITYETAVRSEDRDC